MRAIIKKLISPFLKKASKIYLSKARKYQYKSISVWVEPTVFPPFLTLSTKLLLDFIETLSLSGRTFLELGCGCGIISIHAAQKHAVVTASDINRLALKSLEKNSVNNNVNINIVYSDLFENLQNITFDFIVINPPYYPKDPVSIAEKAWFCGVNFEYFEKLFFQLPAFIKNKTAVYMILSEDCEIKKIKSIALNNKLNVNIVLEKKIMAENNFIYKIDLLQSPC